MTAKVIISKTHEGLSDKFEKAIGGRAEIEYRSSELVEKWGSGFGFTLENLLDFGGQDVIDEIDDALTEIIWNANL